jgi:hypothetical protein
VFQAIRIDLNQYALTLLSVVRTRRPLPCPHCQFKSRKLLPPMFEGYPIPTMTSARLKGPSTVVENPRAVCTAVALMVRTKSGCTWRQTSTRNRLSIRAVLDVVDLALIHVGSVDLALIRGSVLSCAGPTTNCEHIYRRFRR